MALSPTISSLFLSRRTKSTRHFSLQTVNAKLRAPPPLPTTLFSIPRFLSDLFMWLPTVDVKQCSNRPLRRCKRGSTRIRCWEFFYSPMGKPILYVSCWKYSNSTAESPQDLNWCLEYLLWFFFAGYENRFDGYSWEKLGEGTMPWAIWFFLNEKKINIFRLMHIVLFLKVIYLIRILLKKFTFYFILFIHILYCFSMSKVNFWMFGFIETNWNGLWF